MSAGAGTYGTLVVDVASTERIGQLLLTGTASYPTGGYTISASRFGLTTINNVIATPVDPAGTATTCYIGLWDQKNGALRFMKSQTGLLVEESSTTDVHAFQFQLTAFGN